MNGVGLIGNVFFDYVLIFGNWGAPAMGIAGAGWATTLANWVGAIYGLYLVARADRQGKYAFRREWRIHADLMKRFIRFGIPSGLQMALEGLAFTAFLIILGRTNNGDAALAATGIAVTMMSLAILPQFGVAQAVMVLVGQNLGERNPEAAEADAWSGLQVAAMFIACMAVIFSFALKGAGDTRFVTLAALIVPWPLMVLPTWWVADWPNAVYWAWGAASIYIILLAFVFLFRFLGGKWKAMSVIN